MSPIEGGSQSTGDRHAIAMDTDNCILYELYNAFPQAGELAGRLRGNLQHVVERTPPGHLDFRRCRRTSDSSRVASLRRSRGRNHQPRDSIHGPSNAQGIRLAGKALRFSQTNPKYPPMGARFRLRGSFNISTFSPVNQVILKALQTYGMMIADNGSAWYISGVPDSRWDNDDLHKLSAVKGSDFEAVDVSPLMVDPNSGQTLQNSVSVSVTPASVSLLTGATNQFSASVTNSTNSSVTWSVNGVVGGNAATGWIDPTGLFKAPAGVPSPSTVTMHQCFALG